LESNSQHLIIASSFSRWNKKNKVPFDAAASNGTLVLVISEYMTFVLTVTF